MTNVDPVIENSWKRVLYNEFQSDYFIKLKEFLLIEKKTHFIFPPGPDIFAAFNYTPFDRVKAVILGQDPYHGPGQANGLCFSVNPGIGLPPSLRNIFFELKSDLGIKTPVSGDLSRWADQGVLLVNAVLTVRKGEAGSHSNKGWENFTDAAIRAISKEKTNVAFILWGNYAISKETLIDTSKHFIVKSPHPSPFSAERGFFGSRPFSKVNNYLRSVNIPEIDWSL